MPQPNPLTAAPLPTPWKKLDLNRDVCHILAADGALVVESVPYDIADTILAAVNGRDEPLRLIREFFEIQDSQPDYEVCGPRVAKEWARRHAGNLAALKALLSQPQAQVRT